MPQSLPRLPWLLTACAASFVGVVATVGSLPEPWWRWALAVIGIAAAFVVAAHGLPVVFPAVFLVGVARLAARPERGAGMPAGWDVALDLAGGVLICLLLLRAFQYRNGRLGHRDLLDLLAVAIGSAVVAWVAVSHPIIESGEATTPTALGLGAYLPIAALLVVLTADLAFSGLVRNRTMQFASAAAGIHVVAAWLGALHVAGHFGSVPTDVPLAGHAAALCLFAAAMLHSDASTSLSPLDGTRGASDSTLRILVLGISVLVPVSLIAGTAPISDDDVAVRTAAIALLIVAVVARLVLVTKENRETREILLQQVTRDDLTRLPNRTRCTDELAAILESTWHSKRRAAVIRLNLDRFKNINDSFGHYAANEVLVIIADRLRAVASTLDGSVARVGGDDFAIIHGTTSSVDEALAHAQAVRAALETPVTVGDSSVFVTASIGVAIAPRNRTTQAEELMRQADIAAHRAKQNGRNRVEVFDESMQATLTRRMDVEHALHGAIGRDEMRLHHQPIVDIVTGRVSGFEALMRWERQDGTLVSPADFIPVAEETGIICELGAWALFDALRSLRTWIDSGLVPASTTMSVNVSPRQIADPALPGIVADAIAESGVPAHLLWLEITESMMLDEPELVAATLEEIRAMGVRIALDDFGTGFSSLSVLQQFPIQRIKIDRAFVQRIGGELDDRSLVRTIIAMAHSMALDLVAEGVETIEQLETLRELGCDKAQGFLISRPVPANAMRSTMVALEELASLSIFSNQVAAETARAVQPTGAAGPRQRPDRSLTAAAPLGPLASRPLGGPRL